MDRNEGIIRTSVVGVVTNVLLAVAKLAVGYLANSVSIIVDAVNSFSDALTYVITVIGGNLAEKEPDRDHPFGHGRIEHLATLLIGVLIVYVGVSALIQSIHEIAQPDTPDYSTTTILVVVAAIIVKILLGIYVGRRGRELHSVSLKTSGRDAFNDAADSAATLVSAVAFIVGGWHIEGIVGVLISLSIIKTGIDALRETTDELLGHSANLELSEAVRNSILSFPEVEGVDNIAIHSYGAAHLLGSAHIEVPDHYTVAWVDNLQRAITEKVREDTGVEMLGISIRAINTESKEVAEAREAIREIIHETEGAHQMHAFYIDPADKTMNFDIILEYGLPDPEATCEQVREKVSALYPEYEVHITADHDFTEIPH